MSSFFPRAKASHAIVVCAICLLPAGLLSTGCLRKSFDHPPDTSGNDPQIHVTHTIAQLKALNGTYNPSAGGDTTLIQDEVVIGGIVAADDRSGNLYKQIVLQDSSGGIFVDIDQYSLYKEYPVGRKVYIQCKGLYLGYNGGTMELGGVPNEQLQVNPLSGTEITSHIVKGPVGNAAADTVVSLADVKSISANSANRTLIGRLITIRDVQFADTSLPYTDPAQTTNRMLTDCRNSSSSLALRTSNYADFHALKLPGGRGSITGIYTLYQTATSFTPQLVIRDTSDVQLTGAFCGSAPVAAAISIDSLRKMYVGSGTVSLPSARIAATVISDLSKGNVSAGNFILEDASRKGVILYLSGGSYSLGDSLIIDVSGAKLQLYSGALELSGLSSSKISKIATGRTIVPLPVTLAQLNASFSTYESVLVKVVNASIPAGGTYSGNKTLNDGTGSVSLYTAPGATFAGTSIPSGTKTFTGIATIFTTNEIKLRDPQVDVY